MRRTIRLRESELRRIISESVKRVLREARNNRPLQDYADEITQKLHNSRGSNDWDLWDKYRDLDRMERVHALRNGEFPTAEYQGKTYTIDDPLPDAPIFYHPTGAPYACNAYPNKGESLRDYIEGRGGESMEDVTDWWIGD